MWDGILQALQRRGIFEVRGLTLTDIPGFGN
jgi:hypothetical protein